MTGEAPRAPLRGEAASLRAAAALPHGDRDRAVDCLRQQLRVMADAACATPDWTTFTVTGPVVMPGAEPAARFEWTASVVVTSAAAPAPASSDDGHRAAVPSDAG